jgi:hypothetical protein
MIGLGAYHATLRFRTEDIGLKISKNIQKTLALAM